MCRFGGSRAGKTLAFSRPSRTDAWCGCLSVWSCSGWASFSACVLSPYISSGILPMSPPDAQVFVVSFSGNEQVCPPLPFPSCSTKPWKWGRRGMGVSDLLPGTRSMARHRLSTWPFPYHGVDSVCFYHFYVPVTHPSVIAKIIVLFLCCFGC